MAHSTKSARALLRAAAYLRRSTEKQEKSLADQRAEIERYAADNGYTIVRFYQDDGISGDADRPGFNRMLADATRRDFQFILCWDQDRFSRANSFKTGSFVQALIENGVGLVTLKSGPVDLSTFTGRMMFTIGQEAKHQFLHDLSRNTIRGQLTNARNGFLCGQAAPYGYDKMLVDERGEHRQRVRNGEEFAKPRSWHVTLVASDDPVKVQTLKWLFSEYAGKDIGLRSLAEVLNLKGIPSPRGGKWELGSVREILKNRKYTGDFTWAERREGKYFNAVAGEGEQIRQRTDGSTTVVRNAPENWVLVKDAHEALVTRALFARVQAKLERRRTCTTSHKKKNGDAYLLSGIVHCAHCGKKMYGAAGTRRKNGKVYTYRKYLCQTYHTEGKSSGCGCHGVDQAALLNVILRKVRDSLFSGDKAELRKLIASRLEAMQKTDPAIAKALRGRVDELSDELDRGVKRLARVDDAIFDVLQAELASIRRERDRLAAELAEQETPQQGGSVEKRVDAAMKMLASLSAELSEKVDPAKLRDAIRRVVDRIDLHFDRVSRGKRIECPLSKGRIHLRQDLSVYSLVSRGDTI